MIRLCLTLFLTMKPSETGCHCAVFGGKKIDFVTKLVPFIVESDDSADAVW